jgi:flagellar export protein FliJ
MVYRFPLAGVQKLRARERDTAADALSQARLAESKLQEEIARLQQACADQLPVQLAAGQGVVIPQRIMESQRYQVHLQSQVTVLQSQLTLVQGEIERRRQTLVKREQAVRALEQLEERRKSEWVAEEERRNQETLDEWASYHHWKEGGQR